MKITATWSLEEDHNKKKGTSLHGQIVYRPCENPKKNGSYILSTAHIIGWDTQTNGLNEKNLLSITSLADGMTTLKTADEMIKLLNEGGPYIPITQAALKAAMKSKVPAV